MLSTPILINKIKNIIKFCRPIMKSMSQRLYEPSDYINVID